MRGGGHAGRVLAAGRAGCSTGMEHTGQVTVPYDIDQTCYKPTGEGLAADPRQKISCSVCGNSASRRLTPKQSQPGVDRLRAVLPAALGHCAAAALPAQGAAAARPRRRSAARGRRQHGRARACGEPGPEEAKLLKERAAAVSILGYCRHAQACARKAPVHVRVATWALTCGTGAARACAEQGTMTLHAGRDLPGCLQAPIGVVAVCARWGSQELPCAAGAASRVLTRHGCLRGRSQADP